MKLGPFALLMAFFFVGEGLVPSRSRVFGQWSFEQAHLRHRGRGQAPPLL